MHKLLILISGRGSNMEAIIRNVEGGILKDLCQVCEVFSNNQEAKGIKTAEQYGIPTCIIPSKGMKRNKYDQLLLQHLEKIDPDLIILAGYMKILPKQIVQQFQGKIINIHPADTAEHQGLHGYEWAFENKLKSTKVTVHYVDEGLDTGKVIGKRDVDLRGAGSLQEVEKRGLVVEHQFYSNCIKKILTTENTEFTERNN